MRPRGRKSLGDLEDELADRLAARERLVGFSEAVGAEWIRLGDEQLRVMGKERGRENPVRVVGNFSSEREGTYLDHSGVDKVKELLGVLLPLFGRGDGVVETSARNK